MSNEWDEGNEEFPAEAEGESTGMKKLRAAFERQKKQNAEQAAQLAALNARDRERSLSDVLRSKGLNGKLAKFYPANEEASEEKIDAWLKDNADVFGRPAAQPDQPQAPEFSPDLRTAYEQFSQSMNSGPSEDMVSQIKNFKLEDENDYQKFIAFMRQNPQGIQNRG